MQRSTPPTVPAAQSASQPLSIFAAKQSESNPIPAAASKNSHPSFEVYMVGLDVIIDNEQKIKILELQNIFESNVSRAYELTGLKPTDRLMASLKQKYPDLKITQPMVKAQSPFEAYAHFPREASMKRHNDTPVIPNRGIEPMCQTKWLFYGFCNGNKKLKSYIPETFVATLNTLSSEFNLENFRRSLYIFKPADLAGGRGIIQLPHSFASHEELKKYLLEETYLTTLANPHLVYNYPFLIQRYQHDGPSSQPVSKPVIRVYAAVVIDSAGPAKPRISIAIDEKAAYQHSRISQRPDDFTLTNNTHAPCDIAPIQEQLKTFLKDFFNAALMSQKRITYRHWETIVKRYIRMHESMNAEQRLHTLSQFVMALLQEQRLTKNKLSHYQCFLLEAFFECYTKRDAALYAHHSLAFLLANAFIMLTVQNFAPYAEDVRYPLHTVMTAFKQVMEKFSPELLPRFTGLIPLIKNVPSINHEPIVSAGIIPRGELFFTKEDLESLSVVSTGCLKMVAHFARR